MKRIWIFVLLAVGWCGLASILTLLTGNSVYLAWAVFLPPSLAILNALRPRRGVQYAYWNRYMAVFGGLLVGLAAVPIISGYLVVKYQLSTDVFTISSTIWLILFIPGFFLWFKFLFMPAWGPWRLRRRYPHMVAAARRLKRFSESYTWYFPLIHVQGKPYLVVGYNVQGLAGIATLDEEGHFVHDETLALTLMRCYKLAMAVLHMPDSQKRAQDIDSYRKTDRQMHEAFRRFRENEKNFLAGGKPVHELWKSISSFEPDFHAITNIWTERKLWQAQWALEHGLHKLTEVSDQQLHEVEAHLAESNLLLLDHTARLDQVGADAEALLKTYVQGKSTRLEHRGTVEEMLKALVVLRQGAVIWQKEVTEFLPLKGEWLAWQARKGMAETLERRSASVEGRPTR